MKTYSLVKDFSSLRLLLCFFVLSAATLCVAQNVNRTFTSSSNPLFPDYFTGT